MADHPNTHHIDKTGAVPSGGHSAPKMMDKSDSIDMKVREGAGSNIKKQVPGMNNSIVPLIPDHRR